MKELRSKIWEALLSALPITAIVYVLAMTPLLNLNQAELVSFSIGTVLLVAILRIVFRKALSNILMLFYMLLFALALLLAVNEKSDLLPMAFDSGGVASGPMTSGFILPLAIGACVSMQGSDAVLRDAFGVVALVAMTPLITIQILGFRAVVVKRVKERVAMQRILDADDQQIIEFM